ncbi:TPA: galactose-1-phosphate uridyl transferase, partial [Streptococcus pneumoniae]|nr:galactose-1-phosphate uridyl transferase [Streptococcus pneumoniae]HEW2043699.1 galactose-1-phosphate uridyl transferase [Streptococcus pneumoniae]HEW7161955.1 galactose-1-phosphate uridyl transferase [Streptococcus pneumoniae]HEW8010280.1 galactose-1-phosphate uridyl transferase [Streptococcus pneumoniae]HEW9000927.1 galactose-1-phosphate uridyl transferase [Streptococcus pneumoniae]
MKTIIDNFVDRVIEYGMYNEIDKIYVKNRVLALIGEEGTDRISDENDLKQIKDYLVEIALKNGKIKDLIEEKECLGAELMNFIVPLPSRLNDIFWSSYDISPQEAVEEFYKL